jgi:hypothetical protein
MFYSLKPTSIKSKPVIRYFGVQCELSEDGAHSLAKVVTTDESSRYFCKFNTCGIEAGHLVNPWSMYADDLLDFKNTVNQRTGKQLQQYREVSETIFQLYVRYLTSRSDVHYRQAERMALENG